MKSIAYLKKVAAALDKGFGEKFDWVFEEAPNNVAAVSAGINTVAGPCVMSIYCDGAAMFPFIVVAQLSDEDVFTDEEMFNIYETMNKVNHLYSNIVVPVISYEESSMYLRGIRWATFQDELPMFGVENNTLFKVAVGNIIDFINAVNEDFGQTYLSDLMHMFDKCDNEGKK